MFCLFSWEIFLPFKLASGLHHSCCDADRVAHAEVVTYMHHYTNIGLPIYTNTLTFPKAYVVLLH
jgi:hypothetical protein